MDEAVRKKLEEDLKEIWGNYLNEETKNNDENLLNVPKLNKENETIRKNTEDQFEESKEQQISDEEKKINYEDLLDDLD